MLLSHYSYTRLVSLAFLLIMLMVSLGCLTLLGSYLTLCCDLARCLLLPICTAYLPEIHLKLGDGFGIILLFGRCSGNIRGIISSLLRQDWSPHQIDTLRATFAISDPFDVSHLQTSA